MHILHEDNHLIAINKLAGVASQGAAAGQASAVDEVKAYLKRKYNKPGDVYLGVVHRLDKPVTGVLLYARTSKAAARLSAQFADKTAKKVYHALTICLPTESQATLVHYLKKNEQTKRVEWRTSPSAGYQDAILHYQTLQTAGTLTLLEVTLETGRLHQIRVQLAAIGCPILGDETYTPKSQMRTASAAAGRLPDGAIGLHAASLTVLHPITQEALTLTAAQPLEWRRMLGERGK